MCEFLLQHGADVNICDVVSYSCQLFYLLLIMVQVCVVPNNLCFGLSCLLVQVVGQVHCLSKYQYIFSIDLNLYLSEIKFTFKSTYLYFGNMTYSRIVLDADFNERPLVSIRGQ